MNIEQAFKIMYEGGNVESLVSNTAYSFKKLGYKQGEKLEDTFKLYAEGLPVELNYLTKEEAQGEFREIYIVETQEQFNNLSDEERPKLIDRTFESVENKRKFDKEFRGIS